MRAEIVDSGAHLEPIEELADGVPGERNRGSDSFGYDPLDRLTTSTVSGTGRTYAYNGDGLLQSRTSSGSTVNLLWDPTTGPSRLLVYGSDKIVYGLGPLYSANGSTLTTYARDGQKSVRAELNGSSVTSSWRYRSYGDVVQNSGAGTPSILGYAGQLLDPSGLYYMRARWYDAVNASFLSADPLRREAPTSGAFSYAASNPTMLSDASGLRESTGSEGGSCRLSCVSLGTLLLAQFYEGLALVSKAQATVTQLAYGPNATIGTGPGGVTIVNNANGIVGTLVHQLRFGRSDNTVTFGSSLIVSTTNIGTDPEADPMLKHEYGHIQQAKVLGPAYLTTYVLLEGPALVDWFIAPEIGGSSVDFHDWHLMEIMAQDYAGQPLFPSLGRNK